MQSCPKNVHIGPLTGECKRPGALPLPPVALQLPQEPPGAAGPPSPARGSAGMPPLPSPVSNSARPNCSPAWDGRQTKTNSDSCETKWDDSKTKLDLTTQKYNKREVLQAESKTLWNPSDGIKTIVKNTYPDLDRKDKVSESHWEILKDDKKDKIPDSFPQTQGLLAISSTEMTKLPPRVQPPEEKECVAEETKIIKTETVTPPVGTVVESAKKPSPSPKKRKLISEDAKEKNRKRKKSESNPQVTLEKLDKIKAKRKLDSSDEDSENKVKKVKKSVTVMQKDENACVDRKAGKKNQKNVIKSKAKLLKDRNETVPKDGYNDTISEVIEQVIKGQITRRRKKLEEERINSEKIVNRRKSNLEKRTTPLSETQCVRKSKSCSPNRSKLRENSKSPIRLIKDDSNNKKKSEVLSKTKNLKSKGESKNNNKTLDKSSNLHEHSKVTPKPINNNCSKKNGAVAKPKQVSILNRSLQQSNHSAVKSKKSKCDSPLSMLVLKKSVSKKLSSLSPKCGISPKWSNGWSWDSESFDAKVYLTNDEPPVMRKCYSAMRHVEGDVIQPKDCILLKAGPRKIDLPFVAKVAALWENPDDGEMMVSLLWYYRPEHTDQGRQPSDQQDEIFASRHKDINSVACIEDKCFVLTYNEYCRYRKQVRRVEEGVEEKKLLVPRLEQPYPRLHRQPPCVMAPDMVFFCRRVYDFRQKRLLKNPT